MADIFISYSSEDRKKAKTLVEALEVQGWSVWWDRIIPCREDIRRSHRESDRRCKMHCRGLVEDLGQITVGSHRSGGRSTHRGILVPVLIEDVRIPLAFRRIQAADLIEWDGSDEFPAFRQVVEAVHSHLTPTLSGLETKRKAEQDLQRQAQEAESRVEEEQRRKAEEKKQHAEVERQGFARSRSPDRPRQSGDEVDSGGRTGWSPWVLVPISLIPGLGSLLIRGWKPRKGSFLLLILARSPFRLPFSALCGIKFSFGQVLLLLESLDYGLSWPPVL